MITNELQRLLERAANEPEVGPLPLEEIVRGSARQVRLKRTAQVGLVAASVAVVGLVPMLSGQDNAPAETSPKDAKSSGIGSLGPGCIPATPSLVDGSGFRPKTSHAVPWYPEPMPEVEARVGGSLTLRFRLRRTDANYEFRVFVVKEQAKVGTPALAPRLGGLSLATGLLQGPPEQRNVVTIDLPPTLKPGWYVLYGRGTWTGQSACAAFNASDGPLARGSSIGPVGALRVLPR